MRYADTWVIGAAPYEMLLRALAKGSDVAILRLAAFRAERMPL